MQNLELESSITMQRIEFEGPENGWSRPIEDDEKEFAQIATILIESLGWKLKNRFESMYEIVWWFQKSDIEITLYFGTMEGMHLSTQDDVFDLDALFSEINSILNSEHENGGE